MSFTPQRRSLGGRRRTTLRNSRSAACATAKVLLLDEANPVFGAPQAWNVREALDKVPFIASFGSFIDDTSALADLILPDHSFLESWVDARAGVGRDEAVATSPARR